MCLLDFGPGNLCASTFEVVPRLIALVFWGGSKAEQSPCSSAQFMHDRLRNMDNGQCSSIFTILNASVNDLVLTEPWQH